MTRTCWQPTVEILSRRFRCITYDARGLGLSYASDMASFDPQDHANDLKEICQAEGIFDAHLVGHELGGRVASLVARQYPQLCGTLTLVGWWGMAHLDEVVGDFTRFKQAASLLLRDLGSFPVLRNLVAWGYRRAPEPYRTRLFDEFSAIDAKAAYLTAQAASEPAAVAEFEDAVGRIGIPVLLVQGSEDRDAARKGLRALFERLAHVDLATVHGAGSLPMLEHPKPFARTLAQFFNEYGPKD